MPPACGLLAAELNAFRPIDAVVALIVLFSLRYQRKDFFVVFFF